ncbi:MAG: multiple sugar transport system permease protein [Verrucomicrobiota bacterium]|jgi:ABC-type glycerol-3-phosphate transport system permease component
MNLLLALTINLAGMLLIYSLMAFALARLRWRGRGVIAALLTIVAAGQFWIVPTLFFRDSNYLSFASYSFAFCNWLITGFVIIVLGQAVRSIPRQLEDCARLDGCGSFGTYWHVLLPFVRRELSLVVFLTLMGTSMLLGIPPVRVLNGGAFGFVTTWLDWLFSVWPEAGLGPISSIGLMMGASLAATLPVIAVFLLAKGPLLKGREPAG